MKKEYLLFFLIGLMVLFAGCSSSDEEEKEIFFKLDKEELVFSKEESTEIIRVTTNVQWEVKVEGLNETDWVSVFIKNGEVQVKVKENESSEERVATLKFLLSSSTQEVTSVLVKQEGKEIVAEKDKAYEVVFPTKDGFADSNILRVLNADKKEVARLHLEYLKSKNIADQLITIYPLKEGIINYTKGFTLPDGGSVEWSSSDKSCSYTKGNQEGVKSVYVLSDGSIQFNVPDVKSIDQATVEPFLLVDKRGEEIYKYPLVKVGVQVWMAKNLSTAYYRDGSKINSYKGKEEWMDTKQGSYACYEDNPENQLSMGLLYNWLAVMDERGLAPEGFRVASDSDWAQMVYYLDPENYDIDTEHGGARESETVAPLVKSTSGWQYDKWNNRPGDGNNLSGLNIFPTGSTSESASMDFSGKGRQAYFWTSTKYGDNAAMFRRIYYDEVFFNRWYDPISKGYSVRCIIDLADFK